MEQQLRSSEARFRSLIENASDTIVVLNEQGEITYTSPSALRALGYKPADCVNRHISEFVFEDDRRSIADWLHQVQQQPGIAIPVAECRVRRGDGAYLTFAAVITNLLNDPAVRGIVVNAHDITRRKQAEEALERVLEAEKRHAQELATLYSASHLMSSSLDLNQVLSSVISEVRHLLNAEGVSVLLNEGKELVFAVASGPGSEALPGTRMPATAGVAGAVFQSQTSARVTDTQHDPRFYSAIDQMTGLVTRSLLAVPLIANGVAIGVIESIKNSVGAFQDSDLALLEGIAGSAGIAIENARLYEAQREQNRRLQESQRQLVQAEKMAALGRLTASFAHEINNPLQAIEGCLSLIGEELDDLNTNSQEREANIRHDLAITLAEVERIATLVRQLHEFYRPLSGTAAAADLHAALDNVLHLIHRSVEDNHVRVELHFAAAGVLQRPMVGASPDQLQQVFLNLVTNAIASMPQGGVLHIRTAPDVIVQLNDKGRRPAIRVEFADTGPGIAPDKLAYVFEPFYMSNSNGSGIGLSICYDLVKSIGGVITANSQIGVGTTFTVVLPLSLE